MTLLKQSTAADVILGPFVDDTDFKTAETGLTIGQADIRVSKNGAAFAQTNNAAGATHRENGHYLVPLDTTDTATLGRLRVAVAKSGALQVWRDFMVVPANAYDALVAGSDVLQADVTQISGDTQSATDLKDFADAGYDPGTNKVQGVVLVDTTTDLTNAPTNGDLTATMKTSVQTAATASLNAYDPPTNAEMVAAFTEIKGATWSSATDTLEALRDRGDSAWVTNTAGSIRAAVGLASADLDTQLAALPTAGENADAVWEEAIADHSGTAGSTAEALAAAGSAGDPWATALPGAYGAGTAGKIIGDNINATVSSRSSHSAADVWVVATRVLTAGTNIVLAKGTGVTGFTDIDAAGVRTAVGLASADLDTQLAALPTASENSAAVWAEGARTLTAGTNIVLAKGTGITGFNDLSAAAVNAEVLDVLNVDTLIDGKTFVAATKIIAAGVAGEVSGAGTGTELFYGLDGTLRYTVTVDEDGNRTLVVYA